MQFLSKSDFFLIFVSENIFLFFFAEFELLIFHNNIVKLSAEKLNLLKICLQVTYPISALFAFIFTIGKSEFLFLAHLSRP